MSCTSQKKSKGETTHSLFFSDVVQQTAIFVGRQVEQNVNKEVQQYMNEADEILYFEDRAVFSLNAAQILFPALNMSIK